MHSDRTFTGRPRRRATRPWVRAADRAARIVITAGGIGTIAAVLMVGVFLVAVALPLFRGPRFIPGPTVELAHDPAATATLGADESGLVGWLLDGDGRIGIFSTRDGTRIIELSAVDSGLGGLTAIRIPPGGTLAVVGRADGTFQTGRIGLESEFVADDALPAAAGRLEAGAAAADGRTVLVRGLNGRCARLRFVAELTAEPSRALAGRVIDVDVTRAAAGSVAAALDDVGHVRVEATSTRRNLLTDAVVSTSAGATIEPEPGRTGVAFVRVSERGDQVFVIDRDGGARRYAIRDVEKPELMERFDVAPGAADVAVVARLFGGNALAVADTRGTVRIFFAVRADGAEATDGLAMAAAKEFPAPPGAASITAIAASPRSRLFAVADTAGRIRVCQSTDEKTLLAVQAGGRRGLRAAADELSIAPRENRVLAADAERVGSWALDAGYPEVSFAALFGRVWYENYPEPVHAWETTGHESFESKFGLVPLVFGTLKATLYSMLFAAPIALFAAIYSSQFMHPRWRARIKPTIEMMASLPSVVLGFVAGLVFAPLVEPRVMTVLAAFFTVPFALLAGAHAWQLLPTRWRNGLSSARFPAIAVLGLPAGIGAATFAGPVCERVLFQGDFSAWLDGRGGSGFGGWVLALTPLAALVATAFCGRFVNPWLRRESAGWTRQQASFISLAMFLGGTLLAIAIATAAATLCDALRLDTRAGLVGTYVQRNALIVAIGMSFAIIPLIFTIADDALSSVPDHLRSASLGAGATPWQTAVRVIIPAATSGLFSAVMIGLGRAVGETMIVLMAAGNTPLIDWNMFNGFQTLSAAIATELPEAARGTAHYRVLFLAALVLFAITFVVNTAAEVVRQRVRRRAHDL